MRAALLARRHAFDAIVLALAVLGLLEVWLGSAREPKLAVAAGTLLAMLPLLLRRRFPLAAPVLVFAALAALSVARPEAVQDGTSAMLLALLFAFWIVGAHPEREGALVGTAVGFAAVGILAWRAPSEVLPDDPLIPGRTVNVGVFDIELILFLALGAGLALGAHALQRRARRARSLERRAARLEGEQEESARAAVADERRRIARDLHDVVAHSVSVMTVQAGAARLLLAEEPERARAPLLSVEETGRQALAEMRRLLGILRTEDEKPALAPRPGLATLPDLVAQARTGGLPVELAVEGEPRPVAPGVELAAYRIVQEALTNARKHAGAARAGVAVRYGVDALEIEVTNDGRNVAGSGNSGGHGLVGMKERAVLYGGTFEAGPREEGGFVVRARLPFDVKERVSAPASRPTRRSRPETRTSAAQVGLAGLFRQHAFDMLVVLVAVVSEIELWVSSVPGPKVVLVPSILLWTLPLLWRRRFPLAAPCLCFGVQALSAFAGDAVGSGTTGFAALLLAFWAVGAHNGRGCALAGAAIGFASMAVVTYLDVRIDAGALVGVILAGSAATIVAHVLQRRTRRTSALEARAAHLEFERDENTRVAVAEERRRIARDLHDVVAHSVSVMTVQAGAARLLLAREPERARGPLLSVEETGRQALAEMRRLLGILRSDSGAAELAPQPGLADLERLLEQARRAGLPVELSVEGTRQLLPPGVDLAGYRIVQEALTNAIKHAGPARAHVAVRYAPEELELEITNDGFTGADGREGGHGLVGMRERAALYGGDLEAARRAGGGFVVHARLPVETAGA
jgi:signal transduction histidine kinase